jgi:hypothetical protein
MSEDFEPKAVHENPNIETRKYICFVCGQPFDTYYEFKDHIIGSHEEGREYVKCPLARCQAPIRDVILHFKVKHPTEKLPKKGQMRALIWTDHKPVGRKKNKTKFHKGYINSNKNGGQQMHYRSSWERDVYVCLENWSEVTGYKVESFPVEYYWRGRRKRYFPDLFVVFKDGHIEVWEVKPDNQKELEINKAKWLACEGHCETRGWAFKVIDENEIKQLKAKVRMEISLMVDNAKAPELPPDFFDKQEGM